MAIKVIKVKKSKVNFKGKVVNVGIDMHKRSWRITALVEGNIVMAVTLGMPKYDSFKKLFAQFEGNTIRVVYEAGPGGFDLYDRLTVDGIECQAPATCAGKKSVLLLGGSRTWCQ